MKPGPLTRFVQATQGTVAVLFAISAIPVLLCVGAAVDFSRLAAARVAAQSAADSAALAAARQRVDDEDELKRVAEAFARSNLWGTNAGNASIRTFLYDRVKREIRLTVSGSVPTTFWAITGVDFLPYEVEARAVRGVNGTLGVALVLDNTWSMNGERLSALKQAAEDLVTTITTDRSFNVKVGLVPYADYVNVGVEHRNAAWLDVPPERTVQTPRTCTTRTTRTRCTRGEFRSCTRIIDGQPEHYDCTPNRCTEEPSPPYEFCTGGGTTAYRWFGCVGSRTVAEARLSDGRPAVPYPGILSTSRNCLNPIVPLTQDRNALVAAIRQMVVNVGSYKPETYIPAGLIWGINVLSPTSPFTEGAAYDSSNRRPRKVMILMSDGANTLSFRPSDGQHVAYSSSPANRQAEMTAAYNDMNAICDYAKSKKIEIYTIAFNIDDHAARQAMQKCATHAGNVFDASNRQGLMTAFATIAAAIQDIRLSQ